MSQLEQPGGRDTIWERVGDLVRRVGRLEAVPPGTAGSFEAVWGALYNDAGIIAGTGFTTSWDNNGGAPINDNYYTIYFDTPFANPPVVELTANNNNPPAANGRYTVSLWTRATDRIVVITENVDDPDSLAAQDGGFDFLAIEPGV